MKEVLNRINKLCKEQGITKTFLCSQLGLQRSFFSNVSKGRTTISTERLEKISILLHTSTDYLLGKTDIKEAPPPSEDAISDIEKKIRESIKLLSEEDAEKAIEYIDFLIDRAEHKNSKDRSD